MSRQRNKTLKNTRMVETRDGLMEVQVHVLGKNQTAGSTNTSSNIADPFKGSYSTDRILEPTYNPLTLCQLPEISDALSQCISAMVTNVHGFGWELIPHGVFKDVKDLPPEADAERQRLSMLFTYPNRKESLIALNTSCREDYEQTGMSYMEIVRNRKADISELHRLASHSVRLTARDDEPTDFMQPIRGEDGKYEDMPRHAQFRRYVQIIDSTKKVFFKEFGDPRIISSATGKAVKDSSVPANEVIEMSQGCSYSPYGIPRWVSKLMGILGSRKADSVNYLFFDNKSIPPLIVTVSGGQLTSETVAILRDLFEKEVKGLDNFHRALILEATPASVATLEGDKASTVKIEVKPLTQFIESDAQFLEYQRHVAKGMRGCFRIPAAILAFSEDHTRATVVEATRVAEEQVFIPERRPFDYMINTKILADMRIQYLDYRSLGAKTSDHSAIVRSMAAVKDALPVGVIQEAVADLRNTPVGEIPAELYEMTLGEMLRMSAGGEFEEGKPTEETVKKLLTIKKAFEKRIAEHEKNQ